MLFKGHGVVSNEDRIVVNVHVGHEGRHVSSAVHQQLVKVEGLACKRQAPREEASLIEVLYLVCFNTWKCGWRI